MSTPEAERLMAKDNQIKVGVLYGTDSLENRELRSEKPGSGSGGNDSFLHLKDAPCIDARRTGISKSYLRQKLRWDFNASYDAVLNIISDVDQNPKVFDVAERVVKSIKVPVLNPPAPLRHTTRERISKRLNGLDGVWMPDTRRLRKATRDRVRRALEEMDPPFPALLRATGTHTGQFLGLIRSAAELDAIALNGTHDCFVTQFVDFRSEDGLYRKYRFFLIGDQIVPRHALVSHDWNVHASARQQMLGNPDHLRAEQAFLQDTDAEFAPGLDPIRAIVRRIGCDYVGIDCAVAPDGRVLVFEANATMNFFPFSDDPSFAYMTPLIDQGRAAMMRLLHKRIGRQVCD